MPTPTANSKIKVEVVHKNCTHNCKHCFVNTTQSTSDQTGREVASKLTKHGYKVSLWTSSMEKDGAIDLRKEFGQWQAGNGQPDCLVELRDSLPHYMEEMPKGSVFGFSLHGHTPELHNLIVRDKDNFDRVVETLTARGKSPGINMWE